MHNKKIHLHVEKVMIKSDEAIDIWPFGLCRNEAKFCTMSSCQGVI